MPSNFRRHQIIYASCWPSLFCVLRFGEVKGALQILQIRVGSVRRQSTVRSELIHVIQHTLHIRVWRGWEPRLGSNIIETHSLGLAVVSTTVCVRSRLRSSCQHSLGENGFTGLILELVIEEEEQLVLDNRSADVCSEVIGMERLLAAQTRQSSG